MTGLELEMHAHLKIFILTLFQNVDRVKDKGTDESTAEKFLPPKKTATKEGKSIIGR